MTAQPDARDLIRRRKDFQMPILRRLALRALELAGRFP
jgi:hypothetical protein